MQINKDMLIGELVVMDELIPQMLMGAGMHWQATCPGSADTYLRLQETDARGQVVKERRGNSAALASAAWPG